MCVDALDTCLQCAMCNVCGCYGATCVDATVQCVWTLGMCALDAWMQCTHACTTHMHAMHTCLPCKQTNKKINKQTFTHT